jgi:hypothetical protein
VSGLVEDYRADFVTLICSKLATSPFDGTNTGVHLFWYVRVEDEIVESAGRIDAGYLPDRDGYDCSDIVEHLFFSDRAQGRDGQVRTIERLDEERPGARLDVDVVFTEQIYGVVPKVESADLRAQLPQGNGCAVLPLEKGAVAYNGHECTNTRLFN